MSALDRLKRLRQARSTAGAAEDDQQLEAATQRLSLGGTTAPHDAGRLVDAASGDVDPFKRAPPQPGGRSSQQLQQQPQYVAGWRTGPANEAGLAVELSERPLLCVAAHWEAAEVVLGGSDHALYVIDVRSGRKKRTLYTKACGHTEWVTTVCYLPDGRVMSGGMDSDIWLWPAAATRSSKVTGHQGPVSVVAALGANRGVSASYDATVRIWDTSGSQGRPVATLVGHQSAVLTCCVDSDGSSLLSGDRSGCARVWDANTAACTLQLQHSHKGHITSQCWLPSTSPATFATGGQDGWVRVWDARSGSCIAKQPAHSQPGAGHGAVSDMHFSDAPSGGYLITTGADKQMQVLNPRKDFATCGSMALPDFPYSLDVVGDLAIVGCGDGNVLVGSATSGRPLYGLGAGRAAIRCLTASGDKLVTAGDDGVCIVYAFVE